LPSTRREVTGWCDDANAVLHGFVRTADGSITTFDGPGGSGITPLAINPEGTITGVVSDASGLHGFVRAADGTITTFDAGLNNIVSAINPAGTVIGYVIDANNNPVYGFVRKADGTITTFDGSSAFSTVNDAHTAAMAARYGADAPVSSKVRFVSVAWAGSASVIEYFLPVASEVSLAVYDVAGRRVAILEQGSRSAGAHQVTWDAKGVASAVYFYRLQAGSVVITRSAIFLR
jgi:flagellar hook capping protein FlgD